MLPYSKFSFTEQRSYFTIEDNVLYVHRLNYSAAQKANTRLMYNNQTIEVEIDVLNEVDMSPYTSLRPRESLDFVQLNRTIDSDQYKKPGVRICEYWGSCNLVEFMEKCEHIVQTVVALMNVYNT